MIIKIQKKKRSQTKLYTIHNKVYTFNYHVLRQIASTYANFIFSSYRIIISGIPIFPKKENVHNESFTITTAGEKNLWRKFDLLDQIELRIY